MSLSRATQFGSIALITLAAYPLDMPRLACVCLGILGLWLSSFIIGMEAFNA